MSWTTRFERFGIDSLTRSRIVFAGDVSCCGSEYNRKIMKAIVEYFDESEKKQREKELEEAKQSSSSSSSSATAEATAAAGGMPMVKSTGFEVAQQNQVLTTKSVFIQPGMPVHLQPYNIIFAISLKDAKSSIINQRVEQMQNMVKSGVCNVITLFLPELESEKGSEPEKTIGGCLETVLNERVLPLAGEKGKFEILRVVAPGETLSEDAVLAKVIPRIEAFLSLTGLIPISGAGGGGAGGGGDETVKK